MSLLRKISWRGGCCCFRKISLMKTAIIFFVVGMLFCISVQLDQLHSSRSREKEIVLLDRGVNLKSPSVASELSVAVGPNNTSKDNVINPPKAVKPPTSRVIGKGRSPKQVDENLRSPDTKDLRSIPTKENQTKKSIEQPHIDLLPSLPGPDSFQLLQNILLKANKAQTIYNRYRFPPLGEDGLVLIVQVHKRDGYLKQLLESLRVTKGIEKVLLVISHDYYYDDMNTLIRSIEFCRVVQIFYPLSLQVKPTSFPGSSPEDCPRDATKETARKMSCVNAQHPDSYGHYREAIVTAIKHHWWWKVNTVFDNLAATQHYNGYVIFLEEDHYVAPDFVHMTSKLIELKKLKCAECDFINLGMYNKVRVLNNRVCIGVWNAGKNNMGFGMDRHTWNKIRNCSEYFCSYDDYNWDWSLNQLGSACPLIHRDLKVLVLRTPRVFHIGMCGTHHHKSCNEAQQANVARDLLKKQSSNLFPDQLALDGALYPPPSRKKLKPYGGWGDTRDHELCLKFTQNRTLVDSKLPT